MITMKDKLPLWKVLLLFAVLLAGCDVIEVKEDLPVQSQTVTPTGMSDQAVEITETKATFAPSPTPTETIPPTVKSTPTPIITRTSTTTPTITPVVVEVEANVVCRTGPGVNYDVMLYLAEGDKVTLVGMVESGDWYLIAPTKGMSVCWVGSLALEPAISGGELAVITPPPSPTWEATQEPEPEGGMKMFMLALDTGGYFACGDSLVYFYSGIKSSGDVKKDLTRILNRLFSQKSEYIGDYYNPIYKSNLNVKSVDYNPANGHVNLVLGGTFNKPKNKCESERIRTQIWETVLQLDNVSSVQIWVNNKLLGDLLYVGK